MHPSVRFRNLVDRPDSGAHSSSMLGESHGDQFPSYPSNTGCQGDISVQSTCSAILMKPIIMLFASVVIVCVLVAGCGEKKPHGGELTAADLALLTDFHAWNVAIPESQQPVKSIRLVIVKRDGTAITKFDTGENLGPEPCSWVVLGFRVDGDTFTGQFNIRDSKGGGAGWILNFKDAYAESAPGWVTAGTSVWNGNRAQLGSAGNVKSEMNGAYLAIELVK
jgi:hypothetical protein